VKQHLSTLLAQHEIEAIFMGQRKGDPDANGLQPVCASSSGWPAFMRVNALLQWTYAQVWDFLVHYGLPYCSLYDRGYTSLGAVSDTVPNPALQRTDGSFAPASQLSDGTLERAGRNNGIRMEAKSADPSGGVSKL